MYRRGKHWYISIAGVRQTSGTTDKEKAKILEARLNSEAWDAAHGLTVPVWDGALVKWIKDHPALALKSSNKNFAQWWREPLSGKRLAAITPDLVHKIISENRTVSLDTRIKQNSTANQYVEFVARVIRHASNLKPQFQVYPPRKGNERWATVEEWITISKHFTQDERDVLTFILVTGQREANIMFFQWPWDHGTWGTVPAADTKTRVPYGIPFNRTAQAIIQRRREMPVKHVRYVFTNEGKPWYRNALLRALARACKASGVPNITVHALRHTFGTWLAKAKVPREIRMRLMAHSAHGVHDIYTHFDLDDLRPYIELIDKILVDAEGAKKTA